MIDLYIEDSVLPASFRALKAHARSHRENSADALSMREVEYDLFNV